jgi:hypothetical protein
MEQRAAAGQGGYPDIVVSKATRSKGIESMIISPNLARQLKTDSQAPETHPMGSRANVLLSSVFGPYAQDDEYGSRAMTTNV